VYAPASILLRLLKVKVLVTGSNVIKAVDCPNVAGNTDIVEVTSKAVHIGLTTVKTGPGRLNIDPTVCI
jgi:DNA-binding protein